MSFLIKKGPLSRRLGLAGITCAQGSQGNTSISYDATGTVTAYGETTNDLDTDYATEVPLNVKDQNGTTVASGNDYELYGGSAVSLQFAATPGYTYTATTLHCFRLQSSDNDSVYPYQLFYYDDWNMSSFLSENINSPLDYWFASPGYPEIHRPSSYFCVGKTYDSVSVPSPPTVTTLVASMPSTIVMPSPSPTPPANNTVSTSNTSTTFAGESTTDMAVVFQGSTVMTVTATVTSGSASDLKWVIKRDPNDPSSLGSSTDLPSLSTSAGQASVTPSTPGNFELICYYDLNGNGSYDTGEQLKVLLFTVVRVSITGECDMGAPSTAFTGSVGSTEFGVASADYPMSIQCIFKTEGGGTNKRTGMNLIQFGDIGNLTADSARVNYATSGYAVEYPLGAANPVFPIIDSVDDPGNNPSSGSTAFRGNGNVDVSDATGGGKSITLTSGDAPGFDSYKIVHQATSHTWASTQGGYDFTEYVAGYSSSFPHTYVVVAKGTWTIRFVGNRNSSDGSWTNNGSAVTWQGGTTQPIALTSKVNSGSPQSGTTAGVQVLGSAYVNHKNIHYDQ